MDKIYVVNGAKLRCSYGSKLSTFKVLSNRKVYANGKLQANIGDNKPNINIMSFSKCKLKGTCTPSISMEWINGKKDTLIEEHPALLDTSTIMCVCGGKITIEDDGQ